MTIRQHVVLKIVHFAVLLSAASCDGFYSGSTRNTPFYEVIIQDGARR